MIEADLPFRWKSGQTVATSANHQQNLGRASGVQHAHTDHRGPFSQLVTNDAGDCDHATGHSARLGLRLLGREAGRTSQSCRALRLSVRTHQVELQLHGHLPQVVEHLVQQLLWKGERLLCSQHLYASFIIQMSSLKEKQAVIVIEEELILSPDFLYFFSQVYDPFMSDPNLVAVSTWNPNCKLFGTTSPW